MRKFLSTGPSFLTADPMGPLLDQDEEEALSPSFSLEGKVPASPPLSLSSYASSWSPYQTLSSSPLSSASPPHSPPPTQPSSSLGTKAGVNPSTLPWLVDSDLLDAHVGADACKGESELKLSRITVLRGVGRFQASCKYFIKVVVLVKHLHLPCRQSVLDVKIGLLSHCLFFFFF